MIERAYEFARAIIGRLDRIIALLEELREREELHK
jgi:hypothetical protein